ncbi:MAG TPA: hypothetical protein VED63_13210, partial [Acidimicrobiales bacterium]|nr:hypothetical protein [Acidimicrobiales bacterium]
GPLRVAQTGHPLSGQALAVVSSPLSTASTGDTGSRGRSLVASFVTSTAAGVTFTHYGSEPLPTKFLLPCTGSGIVVFSPRPTSHGARSARVSATYSPSCTNPCPADSEHQTRVTVNGRYRITSTDCYFAAGSCKATFDIEQRGFKLSDPSDKHFYGHVRGTTVHFGERWPSGVSEDSWSCTGSTTDGGKTITGTMTDGIGGSGTFVMKYLGS